MLASMPSTKLLLRVDEPETAAFIARQIGEREARRDWSKQRARQPVQHPSCTPDRARCDGVGDPAPTEAGRVSMHRGTRSRPRQGHPLPVAQKAVEFIPRALPRQASNQLSADLAPLTFTRGLIPLNGSAGAPVRIQD